MNEYIEKFQSVLIEYAPNVVTALLMLIVGLFVIRLIIKLAKRVMVRRQVEVTLQKFLTNLLGWALKALLFVTVIAKLGVATTSFAAIIGAAGLAIGLALQGSLSNFAGGALIMIFKPFKVGDFIQAQGEMGTVKEIQIFTTQLNTPQNRLVIIPNGALSNGNITNYSAEDKLRVDLVIGVSYDADIKQTKEVIMSVLNANSLILKDPEATVNVTELADSSVNFAVRCWVNAQDYWSVYYSNVGQIKLALDAAGIEIPYPHTVEIQKKE